MKRFAWNNPYRDKKRRLVRRMDMLGYAQCLGRRYMHADQSASGYRRFTAEEKVFGTDPKVAHVWYLVTALIF
jgi:hypothetical protein